MKITFKKISQSDLILKDLHNLYKSNKAWAVATKSFNSLERFLRNNAKNINGLCVFTDCSVLYTEYCYWKIDTVFLSELVVIDDFENLFRFSFKYTDLVLKWKHTVDNEEPTQ